MRTIWRACSVTKEAKQCSTTTRSAMSPVSSTHYIPSLILQPIHVDRKILDMLPDRPPQVTFSCDSGNATCDFQFWTAQVESFYCALDKCESTRKIGYDYNTTLYTCDNIKCSCVPGRFICGEDGSVGEFLRCTLNCRHLPDCAQISATS